MTLSSRRAVVIIAPEADPHACAVRDRLHSRGLDALVFDASRFPRELAISLGESPRDIVVGGERIAPISIYIRDLGLNPCAASDLEGEMRSDWRRTLAAIRERADFLMSIVHRWEAAGVALYNPISAFARITKPFQIALLESAGLPVPKTLWTNDPDEVRRFAAGKRIAYKPVAGGAATRELTGRDLTDERLALLRHAPVCFQELLPGLDVRVYVVDGELVASIGILTDALDFRQHETGFTAFPIDDRLREICARATSVLGLRFTGMDLKMDPHGELKILELNPSPMFLGFDARAGSDVLGALCNALASHAAPEGLTLAPPVSAFSASFARRGDCEPDDLAVS